MPGFDEHTLDDLHDSLRCGLEALQIASGALIDSARGHCIEHGEWLHRRIDGPTTPPPCGERGVAIYLTALQDMAVVQARWLDGAARQWQRHQAFMLALRGEASAWLPKGVEFAARATDIIGCAMQHSLDGLVELNLDATRALEADEAPAADPTVAAGPDAPPAASGRAPRRRAA